LARVCVSTVSQTLDQQNAALEPAGVTKTFSDIMSGARDDRPGLAALMEYVREGDTVVVWKLDRLGRNTLHTLKTVKTLTDRGVRLVSVTDGIDSSTAAGRMMIGVLGYLAEYERELSKERTALQRAISGPRAPSSDGRPTQGSQHRRDRMGTHLTASGRHRGH
jgi:DNA invertase Pin-like site-specific DNA recombinase